MDGWIEFKISNVRFGDGGFYRCGVLGTQNHIYIDYYVEVLEASHHHSQSQPPVTATIKALNASTALPDSTGAALTQDHSDISGVPWSLGLPLAISVSIAVMIFIASVIGVFCCRVKAKYKQSDEYGETRCESVKPEAPEMSGIVYSTVDFRAHQKPDEVYANLSVHKTRAEAPDSEHAGMVEYSTLAIPY
ncbi:uncharacterized protein LOC127534542 [Acanthochromis polyacanthus]|uniref:uncharacterized protein LOC127534542 n=1 Tax=Acanthochromis polyacanthus TaxID=80966 RepID=UPI0022344C12|nr:uncharacterized protein LOC127534542 [Acanthochromis polyacanthus]